MTLGETVQIVDRYYGCLVALPRARVRLRCLQDELQRLVWHQPPRVRVAKFHGMPGFHGDGDGDILWRIVTDDDESWDSYESESTVIRNKLYLQAGAIMHACIFIARFESAYYKLPMKDQHIVRLRHRDRWTTIALGELLGITHQGASARYTAAMNRLGLFLERSESLVAASN